MKATQQGQSPAFDDLFGSGETSDLILAGQSGGRIKCES
jgi:hypothetical protein